MLGSKWWNKGYATEALKAVIDYLFISEDFYLIEAKYNSNNAASGKLLEKVGMLQDGVLRDRRLDKETGRRNDLVICSIRKAEYLANA
jgi:ribosomal-protein-alanine N-acetyltransferase